jgi:glycosyltransferase involved in cell wall biosynthesis
MSYSIVIATRNRFEALRLSIPRMLAQSDPPAELIVVDASDDHARVASFVEDVTEGHAVRRHVVRSDRGLTLQRNVGLALVTAPIVFFPDDDSIWFPEMARSIMAVYARDTAGAISAVCAYESLVPPPDFSTADAGYAMSLADRVKQPLLRFRARAEDQLVPDPGRILARGLIAKSKPPEWIAAAGVVPAGWMTGFRMTFRTAVARRMGFDENLTRYGLFEDRDASFGAWRDGAVVATPAAKVFHYRSPDRRDSGRRMGATQLLNLAYIVAKHAPVGHASRLGLLRFGRYKCLLYLLASRGGFGRERLRGARAALKELPAFVEAQPGTASHVYHQALRRCLAE